MTKEALHRKQDAILGKVFKDLAPYYNEIQFILGGGTALARLYLHHRVSYDLDFFVSNSFDPQMLVHRLNQIGVNFNVVDIEVNSTYVVQLHGEAIFNDNEKLKISFVEDFFSGQFDTVTIDGIDTENIDGLFHRKLRTISGTGSHHNDAGMKMSQGHRQTARDLFDLLVLDQKVEPIEKFIFRINEHGAYFPEDAFCQNIGAIPWMDLIDECEILEILPPFEKPEAFDLKRHFDDVLKRIMA